MTFLRFVRFLRQVEATSSRRATVALLAEALAELPPAELPAAVLLLQGRIAPPFTGIELGLAEIEAARALATAAQVSEETVRQQLSQLGDLGQVAEQLLPPRPGGLTLAEVHTALLAIAHEHGAGAAGRKRAALADLLRRASPEEARYLLRIATGTLRVGVGDATLLEALACALLPAGRTALPLLERAYALTSDLAYVATLAQQGEAALRDVRLQVGKPVRMMLAERLPTPEAILARLGSHQAEYKYDGERIQVHSDGSQFVIYSRRGERVTHQFPDLLAAWQATPHLPFILEAEAVVVDPDSGALLPFQRVLNRRVKHLTPALLEAHPLKGFVFDLLHLAGEDLITLPYRERRARLEAFLPSSPRWALAAARPVASPEELTAFFTEAVQAGAEGLVCKAWEGPYTAGERSTLWIKYKGPTAGRLADTLDLVIVGAWWGRGRRGGRYGSVLLAVYNAQEDRFETISRLGAGFRDEDLQQRLPALLDPLRRQDPPPRVLAALQPDVWFEPAIVCEVQAQELTRSPLHTAGRDQLGERGLALRFPRFVRFREEKGPYEATTVEEVLALAQASGIPLQ
ncbi:MAG: putative DNA ligase [Dehalococcoidia bacterium]|nr:MAG: putative DNA ligase [Dehalococcoidia bacterium]